MSRHCSKSLKLSWLSRNVFEFAKAKFRWSKALWMTWMAFGVFRVCSAQQSVETLTVQKEAAQNSVVGRVLIDSYHAHNFLHRGLRPKEYSYHCYSALRRAADLLKRRGCEVSELLVGPITEDHLENVDLYVLNLPSMDRPPLLVEEVIALENFVRAGGGIVFVTDHSNCYYHQYSLLPLWHALGLIPTFETVCVRSKVGRLSHTGNAWVVLRDFLEHPVTSGLRQVAFQTGGRVVGKGAVAFTEADAWADAGATPLYGEGNIGLYGDLQFSASEESGRQAMVLARSIGQGRVVVIADQNAVGDAAIAYADNWKLWLNACRWAGSLKYRSSAATDSQWQVICYEPLGVKKTAVEGPQRLYDWGAQDPDQYHYLWVWMNRRRWVACNDQVDVPPEYSADRTLAFIESRRLGDERARGLAAQVIASEGVLVVLGELKKLDVLFDGQPMRPSSVQRFEWPELLDVASYALSEKQASYPVLIHVQNPESLTNAAFPEPGTQPSTEQAQLQETLNRFMDSL